MQQVSQSRERAEGQQAPGDRAGEERGTGRDRRATATGVADGADRVDHRQTTGREGPGRADQQSGDPKRDLERPEHQQGTRVS